ncbi:ATP phosphoribosyltransferase [Streptomyces sp. MI02-7b]|uniref:ATP phosphoribosyltransferase n=1 Tax=Streptomyces sp. MI02-7b TaxID=462941 RepID=UPI0029B632C9|nr:ATP phosphoribosyltransferase [Streptomyces sp. MI02-7b]MDX3075924.1 ATP phosphoribosyltransferase [Streptomyces sp. MI02-7b]
MRIGLPKGRLLPHSEVARALAPTGSYSWLLRLQDIPGLVADGSLDAGITSEEWIRESRADVVRLTPLCWYHVRICAIGRPGHPVGPRPRIVSEYPSLAGEYAQWRHSDATVRRVHGACEAYVPTLADLAVDCVETGLSMKKSGLDIVEELFRGDVWLVCSHETGGDVRRRAELLAWAAGIRHGEAECNWQREDVHVTA